MSAEQKRSDKAQRNRIVDEALRNRKRRNQGYREKALKIYPWVCARCGREFEGKRLRELTVHHKDHDHNNNPPDGSNWELLCLYCHDNEHSRYQDQEWFETETPGAASKPIATDKPFADLEKLLRNR